MNFVFFNGSLSGLIIKETRGTVFCEAKREASIFHINRQDTFHERFQTFTNE